MSRLLGILFFLAFCSFSANCTCNFRYSSKNHPCNINATLLQCDKFAQAKIPNDSWSYSFISLADVHDSIELDFKIDGPLLYAYFLFQSPDENLLLNKINYDKSFPVDENNRTISLEIPSDINQGWLVIGVYNPSSLSINAEIRYFMNGGNCPMSATVMMLIISLWILSSITFFIGICSLRKLEKMWQVNSREILNVRRNTPETELETEARLEIWPQYPDDLIENKGKQDELLTVKEIEEYFPKQIFHILKNPFQQTTCSICLEEFDLKTECCQLFCHHIFHETCFQKWMEKHNSCPECRLPITKETLKQFLGRKENELQIKT